MYRTIAIATAVADACRNMHSPNSKPTDPQIAHIAYTAGVIDIEEANAGSR